MIVCGLLAVLACSVSAQGSRDEGIKALLRGDYAEAVRVLSPLAEDTRPGDHTAQFLMALLYDSGTGLSPNRIRACALAAAAAATGGPFAEQATQLAQALREESEGTARLCRGDDAWRTKAPPGRLVTRIGATASFASDGVIAMARGEYHAAVQHLRVLGEGDFSTDYVAQFFMGVLYQNGYGVKTDPLRACALYHRASRAEHSPFGFEAHRLMKALWRVHDNDWLQRCQTLGSVGVSQLREPAPIAVAPGHSLVWDETGARITYEGKVTRVNFNPGGQGSIALPPRHTRLVTGASRETRDFIELGVWNPSGDLWKFSWYLAEVNGADLRIVGSHRDVLIEKDAPSPDRPVDLRTIVALRVNDGGAAEWASLVPGRPGGEIVESAGDRRRRAEEEASHKEALAAIDWSRMLDVPRAARICRSTPSRTIAPKSSASSSTSGAWIFAANRAGSTWLTSAA